MEHVEYGVCNGEPLLAIVRADMDPDGTPFATPPKLDVSLQGSGIASIQRRPFPRFDQGPEEATWERRSGSNGRGLSRAKKRW